MIISIFASIGSENLGDELILKNEIKLLEEQYGEGIEFKVFTYETEYVFYNQDNIEFIEYAPIHIKNPMNFIRNLKNFFKFLDTVHHSDLIVIGGGGLFYDHELEHIGNPLNIWLLRTMIFRLLKKKVVFYALGVHIQNKSNYKKLKKIFSGNPEVTVRDHFSKELLENLGISSALCLDPVFNDTGTIENLFKKKYLQKQIDAKSFHIDDLKDLDFAGKKVGIGFRQGFLHQEEKSIIEIIEYITSQGGKIIFIPHSFHKTDILSNDLIFLNTFAEKFQIEICKNMKESYNIYKRKEIDICFAMRLHSIILSQVYEIPFVAFSYGKKTKEILQMIEDRGM